MISKLKFPVKGSTSPVSHSSHMVLSGPANKCLLFHPHQHPAPPGLAYQSCAVLPRFYLLPFILHSEARKSLYKSMSGHCTPRFVTLRAHTSTQVEPWPTAPCPGHVPPPSSKVLTPLAFLPTFPLLRAGTHKGLLQPQDLYTCWSSLGWLCQTSASQYTHGAYYKQKQLRSILSSSVT